MTLLLQYYVGMHKLQAGPYKRYDSGQAWRDRVIERRLHLAYGHFKTGQRQGRKIVAQMVRELRAKARHADSVVSTTTRAASAAA